MGERERAKKESRVRMTKRLTGVTVKKQGYTQTGTNRKKGKKRNFFLYGNVKLGCSTDHPTAGS